MFSFLNAFLLGETIYTRFYFLNSWKPTYAILSKHEEYLKNELEVLQEATENERYLWSYEMRF